MPTTYLGNKLSKHLNWPCFNNLFTHFRIQKKKLKKTLNIHIYWCLKLLGKQRLQINVISERITMHVECLIITEDPYYLLVLNLTSAFKMYGFSLPYIHFSKPLIWNSILLFQLLQYIQHQKERCTWKGNTQQI